MPRLNRDGTLWCAGIAGAGFYSGNFINDLPHVSVELHPAGMRAFLNDREAVTQFDDRAVVKVDCLSGARYVLSNRGAGEVFAGGGEWAAFLAGRGVWTSTGLDLPDAYVGAGTGPMRNDCVGPDGAIAIKERYHSTGPWHVYPRDRVAARLLTSGDAANIQLLSNGRAIYREGWTWFGVGVPVPQPLTRIAWNLKLIETPEHWIVYQTGDGRIVAHPNGRSEGFVLGRAADAFGLDAAPLADGRWRVMWATREGEAPGSLITAHFRLTDARVPLVDAPTGDDPMIPAFSHYGLVAPYFSDGRGYGFTNPIDRVGNAILLVEDPRDPTVLVRDIEEVLRSQANAILVLQADGAADIPDRVWNQTIALWCSGGSPDDLGEAVRRCKENRPEKPIIAYLDDRDWPESRPDWLDDHVRANIQLYRKPGEPIEAFLEASETTLRRVKAYGRPVGCTPRFDDFNGSGSVSQTLDCMPVYELLVREYQLVDFLPFADRRGNGMLRVPELRRWARAFAYAFPERPNRYDYWLPKGVTVRDRLLNRLGQTRLAVTLEAEDRAYLTRLIKADTNDGPDPDPDQPVAPHAEWAVKRALREHPELNPQDEHEGGRIVDYACALTGDSRWGRKARNEDGSNKNRDGMCWVRGEPVTEGTAKARFEIYDVLLGDDPGGDDPARFAAWQFKGVFDPGGNGWWAPKGG